MTKIKHRIWLSVKMALGLLVLAVLWLPLGKEMDMAFSGPIRTCDHYGILSYVTDTTTYCDGIWLGRSLDGTKPDLSKIMEDGYITWTERPTEVNVVRIKDHSVTLHPVALASTGVLTPPVFWLGFWQPVRRYRRLRGAAL